MFSPCDSTGSSLCPLRHVIFYLSFISQSTSLPNSLKHFIFMSLKTVLNYVFSQLFISSTCIIQKGGGSWIQHGPHTWTSLNRKDHLSAGSDSGERALTVGTETPQVTTTVNILSKRSLNKRLSYWPIGRDVSTPQFSRKMLQKMRPFTFNNLKDLKVTIVQERNEGAEG